MANAPEGPSIPLRRAHEEHLHSIQLGDLRLGGDEERTESTVENDARHAAEVRALENKRLLRGLGFVAPIWLIISLVIIFGTPTERAGEEPATAGSGGGALTPSGFAMSGDSHRTFAWGEPALSVRSALSHVHPGRKDGWTFDDALKPTRPLTHAALVAWVDRELLNGQDPFAAHGGRVPVPWPAEAEETGDQLEAGAWVGYSRRQLCYIVAKSMVDSNTSEYDNGLRRLLGKRPARAKCTPRTGDLGRSLVDLLAACASDPGLRDGGHGPMVLVAKAAAPPPMVSLRSAADGSPLRGVARFCAYEVGTATDVVASGGVDAVPSAGCAPPSNFAPGRDFMTGGASRLGGQAIHDISAAFVGGHVGTCALGGGQDERLMVYMPEVAALAFFLSAAPDRPQLRAPVWVLGARMLMTGLDGQGRFDDQLRPDRAAALTSDLQTVSVGAARYQVSASRPFLAFMSPAQGFLGTPESEHGADVRLARRNRHVLQRSVEAGSWFGFERQVRAWYTGVAAASYHADVQGALRALVRSVGSGPWGAGLGWGDSQVSLLAAWIGQALAAQTDGRRLPLDVYLYATFTENPGNQCLLLPEAQCRECVRRCADAPLPPSAYWLPPWALTRNGSASSCAAFEEDCGARGFDDVVRAYGALSAADLWAAAERSLAASNATATVFDELPMGAR